MEKIKVRSLFISDIHMGSYGGQPKKVLEVLKKYECETIYLIGDIIDILAMKRGLKWNNACNKLVKKILKMSIKCKVIYITGNHDSVIRSLIKQNVTVFGKIELCDYIIHTKIDGTKLLVIHGDQLDGFAVTSPWLYNLGDFAYECLIRVNKLYNFCRAKLGFGYWSISGHIKKKVKSVTAFLQKYKIGTVMLIEKYETQGIIMGHLHIPEISKIDNYDYYNTGDFVDSCSYIIEDYKNCFSLCYA